jgi:hypothetical protein
MVMRLYFCNTYPAITKWYMSHLSNGVCGVPSQNDAKSPQPLEIDRLLPTF